MAGYFDQAHFSRQFKASGRGPAGPCSAGNRRRRARYSVGVWPEGAVVGDGVRGAMPAGQIRAADRRKRARSETGLVHGGARPSPQPLDTRARVGGGGAEDPPSRG